MMRPGNNILPINDAKSKISKVRNILVKFYHRSTTFNSTIVA